MTCQRYKEFTSAEAQITVLELTSYQPINPTRGKRVRLVAEKAAEQQVFVCPKEIILPEVVGVEDILQVEMRSTERE